MVRILSFLLILHTLIQAQTLQEACLSCHQVQNIPSEMIYRRYLLKYSSKEEIRTHIFSYLKQPEEERSIMPMQFFKKFPKKTPTHLDDKRLKKFIDLYIEHFDVSSRIHIIYREN